MSEILLGMEVAAYITLPFLVYYLFAFIVRLLALRNLFVTLVEEATAKAIVMNGRFAFSVMAYRGHDFPNRDAEPDTLEDDADRWEIGVYEPAGTESRLRRFFKWIRRSMPLLRHIKWIGFPPFADAHRYRFSWTSLEEVEAQGDLKKNLHFKEETIDYVLLQEDVYVSKIETAECSDNIPLNSIILVGGHIVNPYKALFRVERWLESTVNVIGSRMRDFFAGRSYSQLRQIVTTAGQQRVRETAPVLKTFFRSVITQVERDWGFRITFLRIYSVDPGSDLAKSFIEASTRLYVEEQEALANEAKGRGLAARDKQHYEAISRIPGAADMYKWDQLRDSKLTTYAEGNSGAVRTVPLGGGRGGTP